MKKKFNEWRNKLTRGQKEVVRIVCGVVGIMLGVWLLRNDMKITSKMPVIIETLKAIGLTVLLLGSLGLIMYGIIALIIYRAEDFAKKRLLKLYKENLSKDEFVEVFFIDIKEGPSGAAGEFYWYMKNCSMPQFFAKWENEQIYVVLKDNDKFVKDWTISNLNFFDYWFNLSKTESCKKDR